MCFTCLFPAAVITLLLFSEEYKLKLLCLRSKTSNEGTDYKQTGEEKLASGSIAPRILDLGTRWRLLVIYLHTPAALSLGKQPSPLLRYPLERVGPRTGLDATELNSLYSFQFSN
jgi:hypothetical protein